MSIIPANCGFFLPRRESPKNKQFFLHFQPTADFTRALENQEKIRKRIFSFFSTRDFLVILYAGKKNRCWLELRTWFWHPYFRILSLERPIVFASKSKMFALPRSIWSDQHYSLALLLFFSLSCRLDRCCVLLVSA